MDNKVRRKKEPLYIQVAEELRNEIINGIFSKEDKLLSEAKLVEYLGVSRTTVREAVGILEGDGLVKRIHGVGTLITRSKISLEGGMERLRSFTEKIRDQGMEPGTSYKKFRWEAADKKTAKNLQIQVGSTITVIERVRTGNGEPLIFTVDKIHSSINGIDLISKKMGESLFEYLKNECGINLGFSELVVRATSVEKEIAYHLDLKPNSPVLSVEETYYTIRKEPVLYCINIYRTDRFYFKVNGRT